jgi:hypothetical protein
MFVTLSCIDVFDIFQNNDWPSTLGENGNKTNVYK